MRASDELITVEEFLEDRFDLPECGQWSELESGHPVHLEPPDVDHGNTILNLSKALAAYAGTGQGYPCFDLGLVLERGPDTVWFPAVSYFLSGERFAETDRDVTTTVPEVVIELASTADRRRRSDERVRRLLRWGVCAVWVIDPASQSLQTVQPSRPSRCQRLNAGDCLEGDQILEGLRLEVGSLFAEPIWWS